MASHEGFQVAPEVIDRGFLARLEEAVLVKQWGKHYNNLREAGVITFMEELSSPQAMAKHPWDVYADTIEGMESAWATAIPIGDKAPRHTNSGMTFRTNAERNNAYDLFGMNLNGAGGIDRPKVDLEGTRSIIVRDGSYAAAAGFGRFASVLLDKQLASQLDMRDQGAPDLRSNKALLEQRPLWFVEQMTKLPLAGDPKYFPSEVYANIGSRAQEQRDVLSEVYPGPEFVDFVGEVPAVSYKTSLWGRAMFMALKEGADRVGKAPNLEIQYKQPPNVESGLRYRSRKSRSTDAVPISGMTLRAEISGQVLDKVTEMVVDPYTTRNPFAYVQTGLSIVTLGVAEEGMFTAARAAGTAAYAGAMALHSLGRDQYSKHGTLLA